MEKCLGKAEMITVVLFQENYIAHASYLKKVYYVLDYCFSIRIETWFCTISSEPFL